MENRKRKSGKQKVENGNGIPNHDGWSDFIFPFSAFRLFRDCVRGNA